MSSDSIFFVGLRPASRCRWCDGLIETKLNNFCGNLTEHLPAEYAIEEAAAEFNVPTLYGNGKTRHLLSATSPIDARNA